MSPHLMLIALLTTAPIAQTDQALSAEADQALSAEADQALSAEADQALSVESVVALPEAQRFLGAPNGDADGRFGAPHPEAPPELAQFGRLVGIWRAEPEMRAQDGTWAPEQAAVWIWKYTLDGFATQDLWIHPKDHLPAYLRSFGRTYLLTGLRVFDSGAGRWQVAWAANGAGRAGGRDFGTFSARARGDDMVLTSSSEYGKQRITFSEITPTSFLWTSDYSNDGREWTAVMRVRAHRQP